MFLAITGNILSMPPNIILIGPMGVGKTTIGRALAKQLHKEFVDSDQEIEDRTGVSIVTIFDIEGEEGFRKRETDILKELTQRKDIVLATGGGAVASEENRKTLRSNGFIVYLHASVELQLERTRNVKNRPLLQNDDPRETLATLMQEREPIYRQEADLVIDTDEYAPTTVARELSRELKNKWQM